jgi:hypothetical protein
MGSQRSCWRQNEGRGRRGIATYQFTSGIEFMRASHHKNTISPYLFNPAVAANGQIAAVAPW